MSDTQQHFHVPQYESRRALADQFFNEDLQHQREWYDRKASTHKAWHHWLSLLIVTGGAMSSFLQIFSPGPNPIAIATAVIGVLIVVSKGIERIWLFEDTWTSYRKASEAMKREYRLYLNSTGPYQYATTEEEAHRRFTQRVERIIAEEENNFWGIREGDEAARETEARSSE